MLAMMLRFFAVRDCSGDYVSAFADRR